MAGREITFKTIIETILKGRGHKDAKAGLQDVEKHGKKAKASLDKMGSSAENLGKKLTQYLGAAVIGRFIQSSILKVADLERRFVAIGVQLTTMGKNAQRELPKVRGHLEALESGGRGLQTETIPAFQKFLGITRDIAAALYLVELASGATQAGMGDLRANTERLANLIQGEAAEAAKSLGLKLRDANNEIKSQEALLLELSEVFHGFGAGLTDMQGQVDEMEASFARTSYEVGEAFAPALTAANWVLQKTMQTIRAFGPLVVAALQAPLVGLLPIFDSLKAGLAALWEGDWAGAADRAADALEQSYKRELAALEGHIEEMDKAYAAGRAGELLDIQKGKDKVLEMAAARTKAAAEAELAREKVALQKAADQRQAFEAQSDLQLLKLQVDQAEEGSEERLQAEMAYLDAQHAAAVAAAGKLGADVQKVDELYRQTSMAMIAEWMRERDETEEEAALKRAETSRQIEADARASMLEDYEVWDEEWRDLKADQLEADTQARLENEELTDEQIALIRAAAIVKLGNLEKAHTKAKKAQLELQVRQERDAGLLIAGMAVELISAVFGQSKAARIAESIIHTLTGATRAYADVPYPYNIAVSTMIAALGMANVAKIRAQDVEGGFDVQEHDTMGRMGGRRWAGDLVRNLDAGFSERFMELIGRPLPFVRQMEDQPGVGEGGGGDRLFPTGEGGGPRITNVNIYGLYGGDEGLLELRRELRRLEIVDRSRVAGS